MTGLRFMLAFPGQLGRWLFSLGFDSLLKQFEKRLGHAATAVLLYTMGLAVLSVAGNLLAQGIEAGTATTGTGVVHESPVAEGHAPQGEM
jgi:hypothetical protein